MRPSKQRGRWFIIIESGHRPEAGKDMEHRSGCAFCGKAIVYTDRPEELACVYCKKVFATQARCAEGHFVCDACHALPASDLIERLAIASPSINPLEMAVTLMKSPGVKMHGPEHHFLVPAVLLSAFYNASGRPAEKEARIGKARQRATHILGGFCGFYGDCGAAVGTGIFVSIATDATPLSQKEWRLANLMTAHSLLVIAEAGGPRCCKRNSFLAISEAIRFAADELHVRMETGPESIKCGFHDLNKECRKSACPFYPHRKKGKEAG
jgi:hypothetical protein